MAYDLGLNALAGCVLLSSVLKLFVEAFDLSTVFPQALITIGYAAADPQAAEEQLPLSR